jgi:exopolysaccharide biosynthesis polyprenyl glycosylphosphotransferase
MHDEQVLHGPGAAARSAPVPADCRRPYRRFDVWALESAERLFLRVLQGLSGLVAVCVLLALGGVLAQPSPHNGLWLGLFPIGAAALPVIVAGRHGLPGLEWVLATIRSLLHTAGLIAAMQVLLWLVGLPVKGAGFVIALFALHVVLCLLSRRLLRHATRNWNRKMRVAIWGATPQGVALVELLRAEDGDFDVVGFIDERRSRIDASALPAPLLDVTQVLAPHARHIDALVLALPNSALQRIDALAATLRPLVEQIYLAPEDAVLHHALACPSAPGPGRVVALGLAHLPLHGRILKRLLDIAVASVALLLFLPFGLLIALLIKLESPGPVIFRQKRFGRGNRLFHVYKFRSMRFDPVGQRDIRLTERGDSRVTRIGDFLRRSSLDEFPQFMNVLLGHMSVVGPRPHPPGVKAGSRIYEEVVRDFVERYKVRPGITGWAQVNGLRGNTFTEQHLTDRFDCDIEYIRHWSLELDIYIILKTIWGGFGGRNAF